MVVSLQHAPAAERPLELAMRPELIVRSLSFGGHRCWGVKDPVSLRYFQLRDEEYFVLCQLDGDTSAGEIRRRFEQEFAPRKLDLATLQGFCGLLYRQGLIRSNAEGQGEQLLQRRGKQRRQAVMAACGNVLAVRFPGIDPQGLLDRLYPLCRWVFSPWAVFAWCVLVLTALLLAAVQLDVLLSRLPDMQSFFSFRNVVWLAVALASVKVVHELAHGAACRHFGGECHEIGLMLLVFTPCLYCNVSDVWMLRSKWQRAVVGAAGMYVELAIGAICTLVWWFTEPGLFNSMCLNLMFVCSVGTLVFNANPLLRFDGYFILADLVEMPNLQQRSSGVVWEFVRKRMLGIDRGGTALLVERHRGWLGLYYFASASYRILVVITILWFLHQILKSYNLEVLAQALTAAVVAGLIAVPSWRVWTFFRDPGIRRQVNMSRILLIGIPTVVILVGLSMVPLPCRISVPVILEPHEAEPVYVSVPGTRTYAVQPGEHVESGDTLLRMEDLELRREVAELTGMRDLQQLRLTHLEARRVVDPLAGEQIPTAVEALDDLEQRLKQRRVDCQRLVLTAPRSGTVLPPPRRERQSIDGALSGWWGSPLDQHNQGAYLETGVLACLVGAPQPRHATLTIDQSDMPFVRRGQAVHIQWDLAPGKVFAGRIEEVSEVRLQTAPPEIRASGLIATRTDATGQHRPVHATYLARVKLDDRETSLLLRASGTARIHVDARSLAARILRSVRRNVRFAL